jgi:hypothetical protein
MLARIQRDYGAKPRTPKVTTTKNYYNYIMLDVLLRHGYSLLYNVQKVDRTIRKAPPTREHSKGKIFFGDQYEVNNVYADVGPGTK